MQLYLANLIERLKIDPHTFFRCAHIWRFGKTPDLKSDVLEYNVSGIIPVYVQEYVHHIQEGDGHVVLPV